MTGFEVFEGGSRRDFFMDGAGDQSYQGFLGSDRFVFRSGLAGDDVIKGFAATDVIRLFGFGPDLDSFDEVITAATDTASGALITTAGDSSILIEGVLVASLAVDDFIF